MPSRRPITVFRRGASWTMRRAVPKEFHAVETRRVITKTLAASTKANAGKEAQQFWNGLLRRWRKATSGAGTAYFSEVEAARSRLARENLQYRSSESVAKLPRAQLFHRIEQTMRADGQIDSVAASLYLGGIQVPALTPWALFEAFLLDFDIETGPSRSVDQKRRYIAAHRRAVALLVEAIGNIDLRQATTDDIVSFAQSLSDRLPAWRQSTVNAQLFRLQKVVTRGARKFSQPPPIDFTGFVQRVMFTPTRPAFSREWIEQRLLAPHALDGLDLQARCILLGMINTGYRLSEGANLQSVDIRLEDTIPHIIIQPHDRMLKTRHSFRFIPLAGISLQALLACPHGFSTYRDKASLSARLNRFLTHAGLRESPGHSVYGLRHSFEQRLIDTGAERHILTELMGHSDGRPRYARPLPLAMLAPAIERISLQGAGC